MKPIQLALICAATLALAACGGRNEDAVDVPLEEDVGTRTDQLNALADEAARQAEAESLGVQQEQLREEQPVDEAAEAAAVEPTENPDENVTGM